MSLTIHAFLACCVVCSFTLRDLSTPQQAEEGSIDVTDDTIQEANQTGFIGTSSVLGKPPRSGLMCESPERNVTDWYIIGQEPEDLLGKGSFGSVRRAKPRVPIPGDPTVVVKELAKIDEFDDVEVDPPRLRLAFNSPEIVEAYYDKRADKKKEKIYLVLPELDSGGGNKLRELYDKVGEAKKRKFPRDFQNEVFEITCMLAWGVYNLHLAGIIHLDLKLENFMMHKVAEDHFKAVIIDYGLCRFGCGPDNPLCGAGLAGSPPFMTIDQWKNVIRSAQRSQMRQKAEEHIRKVPDPEVRQQLREETDREAYKTYPNVEYGPDCDWFAWAIIAHMLKTGPNNHPYSYGWDEITPGSDLMIYANAVFTNLVESINKVGGPPNLAQSYKERTSGFELLFNILSDRMRSKNVDQVIYYSRDPRDHPVLQHEFFYTDEATGEIKLEAFLPIGWRQGRGDDGRLYYLDRQPPVVVWRWSASDRSEGLETVSKYHAANPIEPPPEKANTIIVRMTPDRADLCKILAGVYSRLKDDASGCARYVKENVVSHPGGTPQQVFLYKARDRWVFYHVLDYPWHRENMNKEPFTIGRFVFGYSDDGAKFRLPPTTGWFFPKHQDLTYATAESQQKLGLDAVIEFPTRQFMMEEANWMERLQFPGTITISCTSGADGPKFDKLIKGTYRMDAFPFHNAPQYKSMKRIQVVPDTKISHYLRLYFMKEPQEYRGWYIGTDPGSMHTLAFLPVREMIFFPWRELRWKANGKLTHVDELLKVPGFKIQMTLAGEEAETGKTRIPYELSLQGVFWRRLCDDYHPLSERFEPAVECTRFQEPSAVKEILSTPLCRTYYEERRAVIIEGLGRSDPLEGARAWVTKKTFVLAEEMVSLELSNGESANVKSKYLRKN